jgi:hypothetical protein
MLLSTPQSYFIFPLSLPLSLSLSLSLSLPPSLSLSLPPSLHLILCMLQGSLSLSIYLSSQDQRGDGIGLANTFGVSQWSNVLDLVIQRELDDL